MQSPYRMFWLSHSGCYFLIIPPPQAYGGLCSRFGAMIVPYALFAFKNGWM